MGTPSPASALLGQLAAEARGHFDALTAAQALPVDLLDAARRALLDWLGVCIGARLDPQSAIVTDTARLWASQGPAQWLGGGRSAAPVAAWVNGSLSHILDYDDTHVDSILHGSGPVWAALLALGQQDGIAETDLVAAFAVGIQLGARLGMQGLGERLTAHGWHATPVLGRVAAAAAGALALRLPVAQLGHAVALAATQAGGLTASFGSMAKPLHAGHAALDAVLAVQLAARGCEGAPGVLDGPRGLLQTLLQDPQLQLRPRLDGPWELARISFKPYASCQLTHAAIDAARALAEQARADEIDQVQALVHPLAIRIAGNGQPRSGAQAKFSLAYCVALGLSGRAAGVADFADARVPDPAVQALAARVTLQADETATRASARLRVRTRDGRSVEHAVASGYGSVEQPMVWPDLRAKFLELVQPVAGLDAAALAQAVSAFGDAGSLARITALIAQGDRP